MRNLRKLFKSLINPKRVIVLDLDELQSDESYKYAWQANIAMAVKDEFTEYQRKKIMAFDIDNPRSNPSSVFGLEEMHQIANKGAIRFIDQLTHVSK